MQSKCKPKCKFAVNCYKNWPTIFCTSSCVAAMRGFGVSSFSHLWSSWCRCLRPEENSQVCRRALHIRLGHTTLQLLWLHKIIIFIVFPL